MSIPYDARLNVRDSTFRDRKAFLLLEDPPNQRMQWLSKSIELLVSLHYLSSYPDIIVARLPLLVRLLHC